MILEGTIKVQYQNERFETRLKTYTGWTAQIIQHEIDHCNGILIWKIIAQRKEKQRLWKKE